MNLAALDGVFSGAHRPFLGARQGVLGVSILAKWSSRRRPGKASMVVMAGPGCWIWRRGEGSHGHPLLSAIRVMLRRCTGCTGFDCTWGVSRMSETELWSDGCDGIASGSFILSMDATDEKGTREGGAPHAYLFVGCGSRAGSPTCRVRVSTEGGCLKPRSGSVGH